MLKVFLCDINPDMVNAWRKEILLQGVTISPKFYIKTCLGSITEVYDTKMTVKVDLDTYTAVSPSNSKGILGGGVDAVYRKFFDGEDWYNPKIPGPLQERIYNRILRTPTKKIEIGNPIVVGTTNHRIRHLILSPTMEKPGTDITDYSVIYTATMSVFELLLDLHCISKDYDFNIVFPGMGTGVGGVPCEEAAKQMISAYKDFLDSCGAY